MPTNPQDTPEANALRRAYHELHSPMTASEREGGTLEEQVRARDTEIRRLESQVSSLESQLERQREENERLDWCEQSAVITDLRAELERLKAEQLTEKEARLALQCIPWVAPDDRYPGEGALLDKLRRLSPSSGPSLQ